jgi:hypothetical protein
VIYYDLISQKTNTREMKKCMEKNRQLRFSALILIFSISLKQQQTTVYSFIADTKQISHINQAFTAHTIAASFNSNSNRTELFVLSVIMSSNPPDPNELVRLIMQQLQQQQAQPQQAQPPPAAPVLQPYNQGAAFQNPDDSLGNLVSRCINAAQGNGQMGAAAAPPPSFLQSSSDMHQSLGQANSNQLAALAGLLSSLNQNLSATAAAQQFANGFSGAQPQRDLCQQGLYSQQLRQGQQGIFPQGQQQGLRQQQQGDNLQRQQQQQEQGHIQQVQVRNENEQVVVS